MLTNLDNKPARGRSSRSSIRLGDTRTFSTLPFFTIISRSEGFGARVLHDTRKFVHRPRVRACCMHACRDNKKQRMLHSLVVCCCMHVVSRSCVSVGCRGNTQCAHRPLCFCEEGQQPYGGTDIELVSHPCDVMTKA